MNTKSLNLESLAPTPFVHNRPQKLWSKNDAKFVNAENTMHDFLMRQRIPVHIGTIATECVISIDQAMNIVSGSTMRFLDRSELLSMGKREDEVLVSLYVQ